MYMTNKEFDKIFRDKLFGHHTPVDEGVWSTIEADLDSTKAAPVGLWQKLGKGRKLGMWHKIAGCAAAAAVVIFAAFLFTTENQTKLPIKTIDAGLPKLVAQSASVQQASGQQTSVLQAEVQAPVLQPEKPQVVAPAAAAAASPAEAAAPASANATSTSSVSPEEAATSATSATSVSPAEEAADADPVEIFPLMANDCREIIEKKKHSFSLFTNVAPRNDITAFSNHFGVMASSGISHSNRELQSMEIISQAEHSLPLNLGLQVQFELGEKISAGVGLSYTLLRSRYEALINKKYHNVKQSLHYIGVPVNFYFSIMQSSKFGFYANVGGAVEKGVKASYRLSSYDGTSLSAKADIEGFQYSANFGFGLEYRFSNPCGIYLEPNAVYFFDSKVPASVRTDQPFQLKAEIGFRFHL